MNKSSNKRFKYIEFLFAQQLNKNISTHAILLSRTIQNEINNNDNETNNKLDNFNLK